MMLPRDDLLVCRKCGYEETKEGESISIVSKRVEGEIPVFEEVVGGMPTTRVRCKACGNNTAYWWLRQLRGADESETRFFKCTKCGKTWREYD